MHGFMYIDDVLYYAGSSIYWDGLSLTWDTTFFVVYSACLLDLVDHLALLLGKFDKTCVDLVGCGTREYGDS